MKRRTLLKSISWAGLVGWMAPQVAYPAQPHRPGPSAPYRLSGPDERAYWVALLDKIATPVLSNISQGLLRKNMVMEVSPIYDTRGTEVGYLEAFGRLVAGMAPWLALADDDSGESAIRQRLRQQALAGIVHGANPDSPDYFTWHTGAQPLVDAAFLAQAMLRAPLALWEPLDDITKQRLIHELKALRRVRAYENNWLLFAAITEAFLLSIGEQHEQGKIDYAIDRHEEWYVGDGWYSDGPKFSFDHYNGYVIQSMLVDVLAVSVAKGNHTQEVYDRALKRMQRYGEHQERMISPEGTYPVVGRSATYRTGAFQPLAQLALMDKLPDWIAPAQVRCALTAVKKNIFVDATFTKDGYLTLGLVGDRQQDLADQYSNTGSMYITSQSFLPLGLPPEHPFWSGPFTEWTMCRAWSGEPIKRDYHVQY